MRTHKGVGVALSIWLLCTLSLWHWLLENSKVGAYGKQKVHPALSAGRWGIEGGVVGGVQLEVELPPELRQVLIADWERTMQGKPRPLPQKPTVADILAGYVKAAKKQAAKKVRLRRYLG